jgi:hypothetical protein
VLIVCAPVLASISGSITISRGSGPSVGLGIAEELAAGTRDRILELDRRRGDELGLRGRRAVRPRPSRAQAPVGGAGAGAGAGAAGGAGAGAVAGAPDGLAAGEQRDREEGSREGVANATRVHALAPDGKTGIEACGVVAASAASALGIHRVGQRCRATEELLHQRRQRASLSMRSNSRSREISAFGMDALTAILGVPPQNCADARAGLSTMSSQSNSGPSETWQVRQEMAITFL